MHKGFIQTASLMGALAVMIGAFGSHVIKDHIDANHLAIFETANRYHFYHSFALLATGILYKEFPVKWTRIAGILFITGTCIFSISLYLLAMLGDEYKFLGAITPIGGMSMILGWASLLRALFVKKTA